MRRLLFIIGLLLALGQPSKAEVLTTDSVISVLSRLPLHDVEGLWQLTEQGATVVIWRADRNTNRHVDRYEMVLVDAPDRSWRPGTVLGYLIPTAQPATYDAHLYTSPSRQGYNGKPKRYTLKLVDKAHLSFTRVHNGISISPLVLFPHIFRHSIRFRNDRQANLDGCIKLYPREPIAGEPRYL